MSDVYTRITERIVEQLEAGTPPWVRPWSEISDPVPTKGRHKRALFTAAAQAQKAADFLIAKASPQEMATLEVGA